MINDLKYINNDTKILIKIISCILLLYPIKLKRTNIFIYDFFYYIGENNK